MGKSKPFMGFGKNRIIRKMPVSLSIIRHSPAHSMFGKAYSSDVTGDGPGVDDALKQVRNLSGSAPAGNKAPRGSAPSNNRGPSGGGPPNPSGCAPPASKGAQGKGNPKFRNQVVDHQKPKSGGRSNGDDMAERAPGTPRLNLHPAALREAEREKKKEIEYVRSIVVPRDPAIFFDSFGHDGVSIYKFGHSQDRVVAFNVTTGEIRPTVMEGTMVNGAHKLGLGWVEMPVGEDAESKLTGFAMAATVFEAFTETFTLFGKDWHACRYLVYLPLLEMLRTKIATPNVTESHRNMMFSMVNRYWPGLNSDSPIVASTVNFYIHSVEFKKYQRLTGEHRIVTEARDRLVDCEMVRLGEVIFEGEIARHDSIDCPVEDSYPCRPDSYMVFKSPNGTKRLFSSGNSLQFVAGQPESYPQFLTADEGANSHRYYRSIYTGFYPADASPFVMYSVNARNATKALKRMCAARETLDYDGKLSAMQYYVFASLFFHKDYLNMTPDFVPSRLGCDDFGKEFLRIARLEFVPSDSPELLYRNLLIGDKKKLNEINREFLHVRPTNGGPGFTKPLERVNYPCPVIPGERGWFSDYPDRFKDDFGVVFDRINFREFLAQASVGFASLMSDFSRTKLDSYAHDHPNWIYRQNYENFTTFLDLKQSREELGVIPHVKKVLRKMFVDEQIIHADNENMTKVVEAKVKREFAKQGKVPRLYVTYDAGCMYANELPEYAKICLDGVRTFEHNGVRVHVNIFAKPTTPGLVEALRVAIGCMSRRDEVYILIYSDDSVWTGNLNGVDFAFNVDISSCDSGNKGGVFGLIFMLLSRFNPALALGLISQCSKDIKLRNPEDPEEVCSIVMGSLFEGSGTVLTTILNHVAMYMVAQAAVVILGNGKKVSCWQEVSSLVSLSGVAFGHVLSVEAAMGPQGFCPEKIQFLKRSPLRLTSGEYVPVLNYGCIFRSFGSVEGDLTADMVGMSVVEFAQLSSSDRGDLFLSGVVAGLVNEPSSVVLTALRRRFSKLPGSRAPGGWGSVPSKAFSLQSSDVLADAPSALVGEQVCMESLCLRYGVDPEQLLALAGKISDCRIGRIYPDECVGAFAKVDYGCSRV